MQKLGFQYVCEDLFFRYYELTKSNWENSTNKIIN